MTRRQDVGAGYHPAYVVWELTLACDQRCTHCGSRAGAARASELDTERALAVVGELAAAGARDVVLIGGEAYLHPGLAAIVAALREAGIRPSLTTGGFGIDARRARELADAGLALVSVSVDGLEATHDRMRATRGSFAAATRALGHLAAVGVEVAANTNLNVTNSGRHTRELEALYEHLAAHGVGAWQIQLTAPLGRAADRPGMILQPWDLLDVVPRVIALKRRAFEEHGMRVMPGNNLGYFHPEERVLRSSPEAVLARDERDGGPDTDAGASPALDHWQGCQAGKFVLGIEADGTVKGCPSLQPEYAGGRLGEGRTLAELWAESQALGFARERGVGDLWGFCATCPFAATCLGGCTFTAHALLGRPGNNPFCYFRARTLARQGLRERLELAVAAPGAPFDNGRFELVVEAFDAPDPRAHDDAPLRIRRPQVLDAQSP